MSEGLARARWVRFSPLQRALRLLFRIGVVAAFVWAVRTIEVIPEFLYDAPAQTVDLFARMWPIDWSYFATAVRAAIIETINIATLGTILALMMAVPLAFLSASNVVRLRSLNMLAQFIFVSSRSINSLIWALLFVAIFGPGALAGMLAIAFRSIGFIGKLFGEAIEEAKAGPIEALVATGSPVPTVLLKAFWPQVEPAFWSIALLRWDINIRESAVLGLVGAGGIGMALDAAMSKLYWDQVGLVLLVILVVVMLAEVVSSAIRSRLL